MPQLLQQTHVEEISGELRTTSTETTLPEQRWRSFDVRRQRGGLTWPEIAGTQDAGAGTPGQTLQAMKLLTRSPEVEYYFTVAEQWEGTVLTVASTSFVAQLRGAADEEVATFELDAVSEYDLSLVAPGAVFYWIIGSRFELSGQKSLQSMLRFRRLPAWSRREVERIREHASTYDDLFA